MRATAHAAQAGFKIYQGNLIHADEWPQAASRGLAVVRSLVKLPVFPAAAAEGVPDTIQRRIRQQRAAASSCEVPRLEQPIDKFKVCGTRRWRRGSGKTQKAKAPEPIALVGLECGVDDEGDDEERAPSKTFSHRMGPDSPGNNIPRTNAS